MSEWLEGEAARERVRHVRRYMPAKAAATEAEWTPEQADAFAWWWMSHREEDAARARRSTLEGELRAIYAGDQVATVAEVRSLEQDLRLAHSTAEYFFVEASNAGKAMYAAGFRALSWREFRHELGRSTRTANSDGENPYAWHVSGTRSLG